ncbi:MAG: alpha-E domain-containing protein [Burkholderiales bacterium]|nr:alpha-E domain-containing protein [Burkholderiales bacterium]
MLSRQANNLYWMSRQIERAENTARLLDVTYRMSLLPYRITDNAQAWAEPWALPLIINGLASTYYERYPGAISTDKVLRFMLLDSTNPSSIFSLMHAARENGRSMRGIITAEMYEDLNAMWLELRSRGEAALEQGNMNEFFEWIKIQSHQFRGVTFGTMLRDEAYQFIRLGTFMERADNTARLLDVKYHLLLPSAADVGGAVDYYQWSALLRSVSALSSFRRIYRDQITPLRVAELLVLRADLPRSLHACMNEIYEILQGLCRNDSMEPERLAGELHAQFHYGRVEKIMVTGLHEYLMEFLDRLDQLHSELNSHFLVPADYDPTLRVPARAEAA